MILVLDENDNLVLTTEALMIDALSKLWHAYDDKATSLRYFIYLHWMYSYDSPFLWDYHLSTRGKAVKAFMPKGNFSIKSTHWLENASKAMQKINDVGEAKTYKILRSNTIKLQAYAERLTLVPTINVDKYDENTMPILVDTKEFSAVNTLLPKLQEDLITYLALLNSKAKSKIMIYGGGVKGAYE